MTDYLDSGSGDPLDDGLGDQLDDGSPSSSDPPAVVSLAAARASPVAASAQSNPQEPDPMAATIYLISRATPADEAPDGFVDGISGVIINLDPATYTSAAARAAEAVKALNATKSAAGTGEDLTGANQPSQFKANYLNTEVILGVPTGGVLATANVSIILQDIEEGGVSAVQAAVA